MNTYLEIWQNRGEVNNRGSIQRNWSCAGTQSRLAGKKNGRLAAPVFVTAVTAVAASYRQADGRYFDSVVPDVQAQLIEPPVGTVPAVIAVPPEVGSMISVLPPAAAV